MKNLGLFNDKLKKTRQRAVGLIRSNPWLEDEEIEAYMTEVSHSSSFQELLDLYTEAQAITRERDREAVQYASYLASRHRLRLQDVLDVLGNVEDGYHAVFLLTQGFTPEETIAKFTA